MKLRKFNKDKSVKKLQNRRKKDKYIKYFSISFCLIMIVFGIIFFSYARYESSHEFRIVDGIVGKTRERLALLDKGTIVNAKLKTLSKGSAAEYEDVDNTVELITRTLDDSSAPESKVLISAEKSDYNIYAWYDGDDKVIYYYIEPKDNKVAEHVYMNYDSSYLFNNFTALQSEKSVGGDNKSFDLTDFITSKTTNMSHMFENDSSLLSFDLSTFDTQNVTDMSYMFSGVSSVANLGVSSFNTAGVLTMSHMFNEMSALTGLDLSNFNTTNVTDMSNMFSGASTITSLYIINIKTSNVENMSEMFKGMTSLQTITISTKWKTTNVTNSTDMFKDCINIVGIRGTTYNNLKVDKEYAREDGGPDSETPGYLTKEMPTFAEYLMNLDDSSEMVSDDETTGHNMRFIGSSPNNYVTFNGETAGWRIIGVFNSNSHNNDDDLVKIIRVNPLDAMNPDDNEHHDTMNYSWNSDDDNNWNNSSLNNILNNGYFNATYYEHYRSKTYSEANQIPTSSNFESIGLNSTARNMVQPVTWKIGFIDDNILKNSNAINNMYDQERNYTGSYSAKNVAIPYLSDFYLSTNGYSNVSRQDCLASNILNSSKSSTNEYWQVKSDADTCVSSAWLIKNFTFSSHGTNDIWSLTTPQYDDDCAFTIISYSSDNAINCKRVILGAGVFPTVYLKNNVYCLNCDEENVGSSSKPYELVLR